MWHNVTVPGIDVPDGWPDVCPVCGESVAMPDILTVQDALSAYWPVFSKDDGYCCKKCKAKVWPKEKDGEEVHSA